MLVNVSRANIPCGPARIRLVGKAARRAPLTHVGPNSVALRAAKLPKAHALVCGARRLPIGIRKSLAAHPEGRHAARDEPGSAGRWHPGARAADASAGANAVPPRRTSAGLLYNALAQYVAI